MEQARALRVLMLSRDRSGLDRNSVTAIRWKRLAEQGIELEVWILSAEITDWSDGSLHVSGTGGKTIFHRLWKALCRTPQTTPDLITAQDPAEIGWVASRLAKRLSTAYELQDHGSWFDGSTDIDEPFWNFRFWLAKRLVREANLIRSVSPQSTEWLKAHTMGTAYWLPIVPGQEFRSLTRQTVPGCVVCVARLVSVKRHLLLIEAFAEVMKQRPDATLILVGDGPERATIETRIQELGLEKAVQLVGTQPAAKYIPQADVFVLLSSHEGWGVAAVEAALVGVPVVMSDTGAARWLAEQGAARIAETAKSEDIAQLILAAFDQTPTPLKNVLDADQVAIEQVRIWKHAFHYET